MKVPPLNLTGPGMDRLPLPLTFSPDMLWRYPLGFPHQLPPSPLLDFKTQMPGSLAPDPRMWSRDDVNTFFRWCEREFDLPAFDIDRFQMNGKALVLLTKTDLDIRAPGSGDVVHNALQLLVRDSPVRMPSSPLPPTPSRLLPPLPPPLTPTSTSTPWPLLSPDFHHLIHQTNSVTLSPAPSVDSQSGSPQHANHVFGSSGSSSGRDESGGQSDSEDSLPEPSSPSGRSPPSVPIQPIPTPQPAVSPTRSKERITPPTPPQSHQQHNQHVQSQESTEPNTNGRLLWDFLQQLLNDPAQRYCNYIAWKNREIGIFKIVDPPGLARLWGIQKNHLSMNYDKMSRALRYYYRVNILRKVQGERHSYQFLRNPGELKNIKNISLLRQQMSPACTNGNGTSYPVPKSDSDVYNEDMPTDLSMDLSERTDRQHLHNMYVPHITIKTENANE